MATHPKMQMLVLAMRVGGPELVLMALQVGVDRFLWARNLFTGLAV